MYKSIKLFILTLLLYCFSIIEVNAATINASSCSQTDVESAISSASTGDTVVVPSCPGGVSWSSDIVINKSIHIQGSTAGCPTNCDDDTLIINNCFSIQANDVQITGFTFDGSDGTCFSIPKGFNNYRIDHNKITGYVQFAITNGYGLIDNNMIEDCTGECIDVRGNGNQAWFDNGSGGGYTDGTVYIEDNIFDLVSTSGTNAVDSNEGARWVFRYNTVNETGGYYGYILEAHAHFWGERAGPGNAGTYLQEVYGNTFNIGTGRTWGYILRSRGGRVYLYENHVIGGIWDNGGKMQFWNKESSLNGGICNVADHEKLGFHTNPWGGSCETYPCPLQTNNSYVWDNPSGFSVAIDDGGKSHIVEDRDYWDDIGAGDTNFSSGTSRPGTCTVNDSYWETDNRKLYRCTSTNTWTFVYEPYPHPHALINQTNRPLAPKIMSLK